MVNWYMYGAVLSKVKETTKLTRLVEAVRNLYILAKKLDDRQAKFAVVLIHYVERTWINGSFPPKTWNMFQHQGETMNNHSEGYNFRLGNKKNIGKHPNFYQWVETIKLKLEISHDEALAAEAGKPNTRYRHSKDTLPVSESPPSLPFPSLHP